MYFFRRGGSDSGEVPSTVEDNLQSDEVLVSCLSGSGTLTVERNSGATATEGESAETVYAATTDRRVLLGSESELWHELAYTDIKSAEKAGSMLNPALSITVWGVGTYRLPVNQRRALSEAVEYTNEAQDVWERVGSILTNAQAAINELERHITAGELGDAFEARDKAERKVEQARDVLSETEIETVGLENRIEATDTERYRAEIRARHQRATQLVTEGDQQTEKGEYDRAYGSYWKARDHLENALVLVRRAGVEEPPTARPEIERIEKHLAHLKVRPVGMARQAHERARMTTDPEEAVESWEAAFEYYRGALEAGWGTPLDFRGKHDQVRAMLVRVVRNLVDAHRWRIDALESAGDESAERGAYDQAKQHYERGLSSCNRLRELEHEFDEGNREEIRRVRHRLNAKYESVRWESV